MPRLLIFLLLVIWAETTIAQAKPSSGERGSIPPGTSRDESRPSEGAIQGGSVSAPDGVAPEVKSGSALQKEINRCKELKGVLREQCLGDLQDASTGGARPPAGIGRNPTTGSPPQNPR
jgi:hypothetical protein